MRSLWAVGLFLLPALLVSCVTPDMTLQAKKDPDIIQRRVQMWLGLPRDYLEKYWGIASQTKDMGLGLRFLKYTANAKRKDSCSVVFTVDITGMVKGGKWSGDKRSCLYFVKKVPSQKEPVQNLVTR